MTGESITLDQYWQLTKNSRVSRLGEGTTTYTHPIFSRFALNNPKPLQIPSLAVFPEEDVLYRKIHSDWIQNHHKSKLLVVANQAHCLGDPGWEETCALPLANWLNQFKLF